MMENKTIEKARFLNLTLTEKEVECLRCMQSWANDDGKKWTEHHQKWEDELKEIVYKFQYPNE